MDATKKITRNLGGDRLGSGAKNNISMHAYNRSTHNLSYAWRSSMTVGTLVPFMKFLALNAETWTIDMNEVVKTIPATGPLYGAYKLQMDVFTCPIRLYNGLLHNNMLKIGLKMDQVKLPKMTLTHMMMNPCKYSYDIENSQVAPDALIKYLGISGIGDSTFIGNSDESLILDEVELKRKVQCVPELAYYDIYKNYYANKQEEFGYYIRPKIIATAGNLLEMNWHWESFYGYGSDGAMTLLTKEESATPVGVTLPNDTYQEFSTEGGGSENNIYDYEYYIDLPDGMKPEEWRWVILEDVEGDLAVTLLTMNQLFPNWVLEEDGNRLNLGKPTEAYITQNPTINRFAGVNYNESRIQTAQIEIKRFPLSDIDDCRIAILKDTGLNNELQMSDLEGEVYQNLIAQDSAGNTYNRYKMNGLAIKTHQSDLLNNWLSTEWIDGENGINQITAIDVSSGTFTIDALNLANKVYNMLNRIAVSGGTYEDWQEAVYSTEVTRRAETPIYCGGMSAEIIFDEVVSTTPTAEKPLGTLAGRGVIAEKNGGRLEIRVDEPSYIIGIVSITPRLDYSQGNDWDRMELSTMDDLHKPELDGIGFEDLLQERAAWFGTYYDSITEQWVKLAIGKTPAWMNYMTNINKCYGDFADEKKAMYMTLNRRYEFRDRELRYATRPNMGIKDMTTYVNPTKFNYSFADTTLDAENFWVQIGVRCEARRVMSAKQIPNL